MKNPAKIFIKNDELNKFLFVLRDDKPNISHPNMWSLIGGGIEKGESPIKAVKREIKEEINIDIYDIKEIASKKTIISKEGIDHKVIGYLFLGKTNISDIDKIKIYEGQKVAFWSLDEILELENLVPIVREFIIKHKKFLQ